MTTAIHNLALSILRAGKADATNKAEFMRLTSNLDAAGLDKFAEDLRTDIKATAGKDAKSDRVVYALQRVSTYATIQRKAKGFAAKRAKGAGRKAKTDGPSADGLTAMELCKALVAVWSQTSKVERDACAAYLQKNLSK